MSAKNRKLNYLTYAQRKEIIEKLDRKVSQRRLASEYGVSASTINAINKPESRKEILQSIQENSDASNQRKRPPVRYAELNKMVQKFVDNCRETNIRITGPMLKEAAKNYAKELNLEGFTASNGWLSVFCTKYKISFRNQDALKKEKEETEDSTAEDRNLLSNDNEFDSVEDSHMEDDVELLSDDAETASPTSVKSLEPSERSRLDESTKIVDRISKIMPPRVLNGAVSSAPTVLHSNGMVFVTLADGTTVEIDNESIKIHTTSNDLVNVSKNTTTINSGTSQVTVKEGVIQITPIEKFP